MKFPRQRTPAILLAASLVLAGCGGGGGSGGSTPAAPPPVIATAEGFWSGTTSSGYGVLGAVLENGEYWVMYHANGLLYGVVQGSGVSNNGNFTSTNGLDYFIGGTVTPVAVSASYRERASLQGFVTPQAGGAPVSFTAAYDPGYEVPASAAAAAGVWRGRLAGGETYTINVGANGALTGAGSSGCTFSGMIVPRPTGRAVYNVSVTFGGGVCLLGTQSITGIGVIGGAGASAVFHAAALNSVRSAGFVLISTR
jgi:hypothetical protein